MSEKDRESAPPRLPDEVRALARSTGYPELRFPDGAEVEGTEEGWERFARRAHWRYLEEAKDTLAIIVARKSSIWDGKHRGRLPAQD